MNSKYARQLKELHDTPWFSDLGAELAKAAPQIPQFEPEDPASVERWKYQSGQREGFSLALSLLGFNIT